MTSRGRQGRQGGEAFQAEHEEVLAALQAIGNPVRGEAIRLDRRSQLQHLGISFPALRARVKQGFSFTRQPDEAHTLRVWDALWHSASCGDVLFAALEDLAPRVKRRVPIKGAWPLVREWPARIDNWCHADALAGVISWLLAADVDAVYPALIEWNHAEGQWQRRLSIVSLIHYSGKNAVFLEPAQMLPLLANLVGERRVAVEPALGWVLRELGRQHPDELARFLDAHAARLGAKARTRAREALVAR